MEQAQSAALPLLGKEHQGGGQGQQHPKDVGQPVVQQGFHAAEKAHLGLHLPHRLIHPVGEAQRAGLKVVPGAKQAGIQLGPGLGLELGHGLGELLHRPDAGQGISHQSGLPVDVPGEQGVVIDLRIGHGALRQRLLHLLQLLGAGVEHLHLSKVPGRGVIVEQPAVGQAQQQGQNHEDTVAPQFSNFPFHRPPSSPKVCRYTSSRVGSTLWLG